MTSYGQTQDELELRPQSVIELSEPIRVADNSNGIPQSTRRTLATDERNPSAPPAKSAPMVIEQGGVANPQASPTTPQRLFEPVQSNRLINRSQAPPAPAPAPGPAAAVAVAPGADLGANYQAASPVKPLSVQNVAPAISTEIELPGYINLNQPAKLRIKLHNSGNSPASSVKLMATIPFHATFAGSNPPPSNQSGQVYEFQILDIGAKQTREVVIELIPTAKKPIEIGTEVIIENLQRITVGVREPIVKLALKGPTEANLGQQIVHKVLLENTGDGRAERIELQATFPQQLRCDKKSQLVIPTLEPGQKLEIELPSLATGAGKSELAISIAATGIEAQTVKSGIQVYQPELEVAASGPQVNFLNREGIYTLNIDNTGEMEASNVVVELQVPAGMKVTTISHQAKLDPNTGRLTWTFDQIAAKSNQTIKLLTVATKQGQQDCVFTLRSKLTKDKTIYLSTNVVTRPELTIKLQNQSGPVQIGGKVQFLVVVENTGSDSATDIKVAVELPEALTADKQDGVEMMSISNQIQFQAAKLEAGQKREFRFDAIAAEKGEHVIRTILTTAASERQLISEGVAFVYELNENRVSESLVPAIVR